MNAALLDLSRLGETSEELLANVLLARRINRVLGGAFVSPWEVNDLPDDEIDRILSIEEIGAYQAGRQQVENSMRNWRENNPAYTAGRRVH